MLEYFADKIPAVGFGGILGAAAIFILGLLRVRKDTARDHHLHELGMTQEQRQMIESTWQQVNDQTKLINLLQKQLTRQRTFYESKLEEMRKGYQARMRDYQDQLREQYDNISTLQQRVNKFERHCQGCINSMGERDD